jgi:hypothetical protein
MWPVENASAASFEKFVLAALYSDNIFATILALANSSQLCIAELKKNSRVK